MGMKALRWARHSRGLTPTQKLVLYVLADAASDDTHTCWNASASIAEETGLSDRAVRTALHDLIEAGAIIGTMHSGVRPKWVLAVVEAGTIFLPKRNGLPIKKRNHVPANRKLVPVEERKQVPSKPETRSAKPETRSAEPEPVSDEPSRTLYEPPLNPAARATAPAIAVTLPGWLPVDAWDEWCRHRIAKDRKGWTQAAAVKCIAKLGELRAGGCEPRAVIDQSIASGWTGLFGTKRQGGGQGGGQVSGIGQVMRALRAAKPQPPQPADEAVGPIIEAFAEEPDGW